jgi:ABC-type sugar transport system, permease component
MALTALKTQREALAQPPVWIFEPQWSNFIRAWDSNDFGRSFLVTTSVSVFSVILTMLLSIPTGYVLARYRRGWLSAFEIGMMVIRMLPEILFMLPLYIIFQRTGLFDTQLGIIIAFQIFNMPFSAWLIRQFVSEVPVELDEAALLDGANLWQVLWHVIIPTIRPGHRRRGGALLHRGLDQSAAALGADLQPDAAGRDDHRQFQGLWLLRLAGHGGRRDHLADAPVPVLPLRPEIHHQGPDPGCGEGLGR